MAKLRKFAPWELEDIHVDLITPEHFEELEDGTALVSITGEVSVKGMDEIDLDTRGGFIAYGFLCKVKHSGENGMGMYEKEV